MRTWIVLAVVAGSCTTADVDDTDAADTDAADTDAADTDAADTDAADTDVADTDVADTDVVETGETDGTVDTDETDDTDVGACGAIPPDAYVPDILWSERSYEDGLVRARGAVGSEVITNEADLAAFLALVGSPAVTVDFTTTTVVAVWYQTSSSCGVFAGEALAWTFGSTDQSLVVRIEDVSFSCCYACAALGGVVQLVSFPRATRVDVCVEPYGGCEDETDSCP